jgi:hypothetical protein
MPACTSFNIISLYSMILRRSNLICKNAFKEKYTVYIKLENISSTDECNLVTCEKNVPERLINSFLLFLR